ncbi:MAG: PQQ-binding-like beta-propeller repeat protein [Patescibacteria group bacterium]
MRFILAFFISVLVASCGANNSSTMDEQTQLQDQLVKELNKQLSMTWEPDIEPIKKFDEETRTLYWCLRGDYDLTGEVGISDVTPISQYFQQSVDGEVSPPLIHDAPWWVDGDDNGQITTADITPIARNFQARAFWWKTSVGWGQTYGPYAGLFFIQLPEDVNPEEVVLKISSEPEPEVEPENIAPIAILQANAVTGLVPFEVTFDFSSSIDIDGEIATYDLDLDGDGYYDDHSVPTPGSVTKLYDSPGSFLVKLRVTDNDGAVGFDSYPLVISTPDNQPPVAKLTVTPSFGQVPLDVILDASESFDPDGHIYVVQWDFEGDGIWDMQSVGPDSIQPHTHTYTEPGKYIPRIRVKDNDNVTSVAEGAWMMLTAPSKHVPTANLTANPTFGIAPLSVVFNSAGSNDPDGYIVQADYDFNNDGIWDAYDADLQVNWEYTEPGLHVAKVRVTDNDDYEDYASLVINVGVEGNLPPLAFLSADLVAGNAPFEVNFNATGSSDPDGTIVRYDYDFNGDQIWDAYDSPAQVAWTFQEPGNYASVVRVTDDDGEQSWTYINIEVGLGSSGGDASGPGDWAMFGRDPQHTSQSPFTGPQNATLAWEYQLGGNLFRSSPVMDQNGVIYIGCSDYYLYAINPDGSLKWRFLTGYVVYSTPAIGPDGTVYITDNDAQMYALNPNDGALIWQCYLGGSDIISSPVIDTSGRIYIGTPSGLKAVSSSGTIEWSFQTNGNVQSSPAITPSGNLVFGTSNSRVYSVHPIGFQNWVYVSETPGTSFESSPAINPNGDIYIGATNGYLYAVKNDGNLDWKFATGGGLYSSPAIANDGTVYIGGSYDHYFYAINSDGTMRWRYQTNDRINSSPCIGLDGTVYFGDLTPSGTDLIYAVSQDGQLKWVFPAGGEIQTSPCIGPDGSLYIGGGRNLFAFRD